MKEADLKSEGETHAVILKQDGAVVSVVSGKTLEEAEDIAVKWRNGEYLLLVE